MSENQDISLEGYLFIFNLHTVIQNLYKLSCIMDWCDFVIVA